MNKFIVEIPKDNKYVLCVAMTEPAINDIDFDSHIDVMSLHGVDTKYKAAGMLLIAFIETMKSFKSTEATPEAFSSNLAYSIVEKFIGSIDNLTDLGPSLWQHIELMGKAIKVVEDEINNRDQD